jgi:hypothetical protein
MIGQYVHSIIEFENPRRQRIAYFGGLDSAFFDLRYASWIAGASAANSVSKNSRAAASTSCAGRVVEVNSP